MCGMAAFSSGSMDQPADLAEDVHRLLDDLAKRRADRRHVVAGECMPVVDVFETEKTVEIVLDLPGVAADAVRILFKAGVLLIVGEKERPDLTKRGPASFHLVERDFGRFARAVQDQRGDRRRAGARPAGQRRTARRAAAHHRSPRRRTARPDRYAVTRMKLLFLGDIVGRPGRDLIRRHVRALASRHDADLVIANGENAAGGAGITRENMLEILSAGVDVITTGNHVWDKRETLEFIGNEPRLLRPANYPEGTPGAGSCVVDGEERRRASA